LLIVVDSARPSSGFSFSFWLKLTLMSDVAHIRFLTHDTRRYLPATFF
jgi:hypothetical protein